MRTLSHLISLSLATMVSAPVVAQERAPLRAGASYPRPNIDTASPTMVRPEVTTRTVGTGPVRRDRWGSRVDGRWWGGANAPGGWPAYRRPVRGTVLPGYWNSPRFAIDDWAVYRLPQPPAGYRWSRYYDDAVLIDPRGVVGVYAAGGPDIRLLFGHPKRAGNLFETLAISDVDDDRHARGAGATKDVLPVAIERRSVDVGVAVDEYGGHRDSFFTISHASPRTSARHARVARSITSCASEARGC